MERSLGVLLFLQFFLLSSSAFSKHASNGIDWWCRKTTYPETCKYFFNNGSKAVPKDMPEFKKMVIQFAMERALTAETHTKGVGWKCRNEKEKAAWADCLKLYQNTIFQLNHTLDSSTKCTEFDIQTWLSTALTNLETCRTGFAELNVSDYVLPLITSNNVTKLISNSLAVNNASAWPGKETYKGVFPTWLSGGDRRLLQSSSLKADLVVAKDGSGNHTTIGAALVEASLLAIEVLEEAPPLSILLLLREAFLTWKLVQQWKDGNASRIGVIIPDLASGAESLPVSLVNDVDDEKGPAYFTYYAVLKYLKPVYSMEPSAGCNCIGGCLPDNLNCPCMQKNGGYLPYSSNGVLASQQSMIYECGASCQCPPNCRNRVSQGGLKFRLEVFRTKGKGWGLRSWDPIRAGAFICQYAGEVIDPKAKDSVGDNEDGYVFDATRSYPNLEVMSGDSDGPPRLPFPLVISAKNAGNVARFMNHSCSPNVFWKPILRENKGEHDIHIAFHAIRHVPPMMELTYDYGIVPPDLCF